MEHVMNHNTQTAGIESVSLVYLAEAGTQASGEAALLLTREGVRAAARAQADGPHTWRSRSVSETVQAFVASGGRVVLYHGCAQERGISQGDLIEGAAIIGGNSAVSAPTRRADYRPDWFGARVAVGLS